MRSGPEGKPARQQDGRLPPPGWKRASVHAHLNPIQVISETRQLTTAGRTATTTTPALTSVLASPLSRPLGCSSPLSSVHTLVRRRNESWKLALFDLFEVNETTYTKRAASDKKLHETERTFGMEGPSPSWMEDLLRAWTLTDWTTMASTTLLAILLLVWIRNTDAWRGSPFRKSHLSDADATKPESSSSRKRNLRIWQNDNDEDGTVDFWQGVDPPPSFVIRDEQEQQKCQEIVNEYNSRGSHVTHFCFLTHGHRGFRKVSSREGALLNDATQRPSVACCSVGSVSLPSISL